MTPRRRSSPGARSWRWRPALGAPRGERPSASPTSRRRPERAGWDRALLVFCVVAVGAGWALTLLLLAVAPDQQASLLLHALMVYPISYAPFAAALLALHVEADAGARRAFWGRLRAWRRGWRWYALALCLPPAVYLTGVGLATAFGGRVPFSPAFVVALAYFVPANFGEEAGRRGRA